MFCVLSLIIKKPYLGINDGRLRYSMLDFKDVAKFTTFKEVG